MLSQNENNRYSRHLNLAEIGIEGQEKLKQSHVLVIGAGGLGCAILQYLTAVGVGTIGIVDFDVVDESNLQRQILYSVDDIGKSKVDCAVKRLSQQNPFVKFVSYNSKLTNKNAIDIIKEYDIIVDGTDNFATRYLVNDACVLLNKPLVYGSIHKFEGQVTVFNYATKDGNPGPTYRCLFPNSLSQESAPNCSEAGVLGVLPGIIGTLQASEVIKIIVGIGDVLSGQLAILNVLTMQFFVISFERNKSMSELMPINIDQFKNNDYGLICSNSIWTSVNEIAADELETILSKNRNEIQLLDIREYSELPILNELKELHIPLAEIIESINKIDRNKKVVVICKSGVRSNIAIQLLQKKYGIENLYNLKGGLSEWKKKYKL